MTIQEAIEKLTAKVKCMTREISGADSDCVRQNCDECVLCYTQGTSKEQIEAINMAINALKKQIPMKMPGTFTDYKCTVCGRRLRSGKGSSSFKSRDNFCQRCGQAVDWEEENA